MVLLVSLGLSWVLLGSPGLSWALMGSLGLSWALLGCVHCQPRVERTRRHNSGFGWSVFVRSLSESDFYDVWCRNPMFSKPYGAGCSPVWRISGRGNTHAHQWVRLLGFCMVSAVVLLPRSDELYSGVGQISLFDVRNITKRVIITQPVCGLHHRITLGIVMLCQYSKVLLWFQSHIF